MDVAAGGVKRAPQAAFGVRARHMIVAIIDYGSGNLRSAAKSFERAALEHEISAEIRVTADPKLVGAADRIVLPGVGAFADCLAGLEAISGMRDTVERAVRERNRPYLGICVGLQLMADRGLEHGEHRGFGWIAGDVVPFEVKGAALKIPHMGWNELRIASDHALTDGLAVSDQAPHAYFVHSYFLKARDPGEILATTHYGSEITVAVAKQNMAGTQFHPEKSQQTGLQFIANFLRWRP